MKPSQTDLKSSNRASVPGNTISGRMGEGDISGPAFFPPKGLGAEQSTVENSPSVLGHLTCFLTNVLLIIH